MFPPIEDSVLQSNPNFAALYANLTNNILNPSGSTKHDAAQKERDAVAEDLKNARFRTAKRHLIRNAICLLDLSPPSPATKKSTSAAAAAAGKPSPASALPAELVELILLLSSALQSSTPLSRSSQTLLSSTPPWANLPTHLPQLGALVSTHLQTQALAVARILSPTTNASFLHRTIPKLPGALAALQDAVAAKRADVERRRAALVSLTVGVLARYAEASALVIQLLEQAKHGAVARHLKAKMEYLGLLAEQVRLEVAEKKARAERMVYTDEVWSALGNYTEHLRDGRERLKERKAQAERVLWGYGVGREDGEKEKVMREIARVYGELKREMRDVGRDVDKLKGS